MSSILPGDVVFHSELATKMTVEKVSEGIVSTVWFDSNHNLHRNNFLQDSLQEVDPSKSHLIESKQILEE